MQAFYHGTKVKITKSIKEDVIQKRNKNLKNDKIQYNQETGQYDGKDLLAWLSLNYKKPHKDAIGVIAITDVDLAIEELNFLFGLASPSSQVGVASVYRYRPDFTQEVFSDEQEEYNSMLYRITKTACHEVGHMFGLLHCVFYQCAMNGSNDLEQTDQRPIYLCPVC